MTQYIENLDVFQELMYPTEYFDPVEVLELIDELELLEMEVELDD